MTRLLEYLYHDPGAPPTIDSGPSDYMLPPDWQPYQSECNRATLYFGNPTATLDGRGFRFYSKHDIPVGFDGTYYDEQEAVRFRHVLSDVWEEGPGENRFQPSPGAAANAARLRKLSAERKQLKAALARKRRKAKRAAESVAPALGEGGGRFPAEAEALGVELSKLGQVGFGRGKRSKRIQALEQRLMDEFPEYWAFREASFARGRDRNQASLRRTQASLRSLDHQKALRAEVQKELRKLGFKQERSRGGSSYYELETLGGRTLRVRVSDHDVPMTREREHNAQQGGFTWAQDGWNFVIAPDTSKADVLRDLVRLRKEVRKVSESVQTLDEVLKQGKNVHSAYDNRTIRRLEGDGLPGRAEDGKGFCFQWADGRGVCGFKFKNDALRWLKDEPRDVVKFWYGEPVHNNGKFRFRVINRYAKNEATDEVFNVHSRRCVRFSAWLDGEPFDPV